MLLKFDTKSEAEIFDLLKLPEIFAIEEAEATLFHPQNDILKQAGCWERTLDYLIKMPGLVPTKWGRACDIEWSKGAERVKLKGVRASPRFAKWIRVNVGDQILVAAFVPHLYVSASGSEYIDYRFVVCTTDDSIVPIVSLFTDHIIGHVREDEPWELGLESSESSGSTNA